MAVRVMEMKKVRRLPVINKRMVGMLSLGETSRMVGACRDVAQRAQPCPLHARMVTGIERSRRADHPLKKCSGRTRRSVAVVDLETQALRPQIGLHSLQHLGDGGLQDAFSSLIAGNRPSDEVIGARIAHILEDLWGDIAQVNKTGRKLACACASWGEEKHHDESSDRAWHQ